MCDGESKARRDESEDIEEKRCDGDGDDGEGEGGGNGGLTFAVFDQGGRGEHVVDGVGGRDLLLLQVQVLVDVAAKLALPPLPRLGIFVA